MPQSLVYHDSITLVTYIISAEATVRIETPTVMVREDEGVAMVCVIVEDAEDDCPIVFPFEVDFITNDGSASKYTTIFHYSPSRPSILSSLLNKLSRVSRLC